MSFAMWKLASVPPEKAGRYLVGNRKTGEVNVARYMPVKKEWKFASASQKFEVGLWDDLPSIPGPKEES